MIPVTQAPSVAVRALARLVASTAAFQSLVGATGETDQEKEDTALAHVYWHEADDLFEEDDEDEAARKHPRPRAILSDYEEEDTEMGAACWQATGSMILTLEAPAPESIEDGDVEEIRDRYDWWTETYGAIKEQMKENKYSQPDKYLNVRTFRLLGFGEERHEGPAYFDAAYQVEFF